MSSNREDFTRNGLIQVGLRLQKARKACGFTLDELARRTHLSKSLLSKIENFRSIPSLPVLAKLAQALSVDVVELVQGIGEASEENCCLVRAGDRTLVDRDDAVGFLHEAIFARALGREYLEVFLLTLEPGAKRKLSTTDGQQFVFMLEGSIEFCHGDEQYTLGQGDALYFDGRIPHVPLNPGKEKARFLSVYLLMEEK